MRQPRVLRSLRGAPASTWTGHLGRPGGDWDRRDFCYLKLPRLWPLVPAAVGTGDASIPESQCRVLPAPRTPRVCTLPSTHPAGAGPRASCHSGKRLSSGSFFSHCLPHLACLSATASSVHRMLDTDNHLTNGHVAQCVLLWSCLLFFSSRFAPTAFNWLYYTFLYNLP